MTIMTTPEQEKPKDKVCEACPILTDVLYKAYGMELCKDCKEKEDSLQAESKANANQRVLDMNSLLTKSRDIDSSISFSQDLFNAQTVAISDLKKAIDTDSTIENKDFKLAETVLERINKFKQLIFDTNAKLLEYNSSLRANQTYLNNLQVSLRQEEREKLKLQDMTYQPAESKPKKAKLTTPKSKLDIAELKKYAGELGLPHTVLQMTCVSRNMTPVQAYEHMKKAMGK